MSSERQPRMAWRAFVLSGLGFLLGTPLAYGQPVRLRLKVDRNTVQVGDRTGITVELLDQNYRPASNDRTRSIRFDLRGTGQGQTASGNISPNPGTGPRSAAPPTGWHRGRTSSGSSTRRLHG